MKTKRAISIFLSILLVLSILPVTALTAFAQAQECIWNLYVGTVNKGYISGPVVRNIETGLTAYDNTVYLSNYNGSSLAAIPGGFIGDDHSPVLTLNLHGNNYLSGGYFHYSSGSTAPVAKNEIPASIGATERVWYGALYAEQRGGGTGDNSKIIVKGTGTLHINISTYGLDRDIFAVKCGELFEVQSGKVIITVSSVYVKGSVAVGVESSKVIVTKTGILDINLSPDDENNPYGTPYYSKCNVYGVANCNATDADVFVNAIDGYFSCDVADSAVAADKTTCCVKGKVTYEDVNGWMPGLYLRSKYNVEPCTNGVKYPEKKALTKYQHNSSSMKYFALLPMEDNSKGIQGISIDRVVSLLKVPKVNDKKIPAMTTPSKNAFGGFYYTCNVLETDKDCEQSITYNGETYNTGNVFELYLNLLPMPGYAVYLPEDSRFNDESDMTAENLIEDLQYRYDFAPYKATVSTHSLSAYYFFMSPVILDSPEKVTEDDSEVSVSATVFKGFPEAEDCFTYEWFMNVYKDNKLVETISMEEFDEMGYGFTDQCYATMNLGSIGADEELPDGRTYTLGEMDKTTLFCRVTGIAGYTDTPEAVYEPFKRQELKYTLGDVNGDKEIKAADARLCLRASVGLESYAEGTREYLACDVNGDGDIKAADARLILRYSVGLESFFPAGKPMPG